MIPPLQQLHDLDKSSPQFREQLRGFFRGDVYRNALKSLQSEDWSSLVEYLDTVVVDISNHAIPVFREPLCELGHLCRVKDVLPKSWSLQESLIGCVYEGTFNGSKVRIRRVRAHSGGDSRRVKEAFRQVAVISKRSAHPNIVPLLGVTMDPPELISDWMPGGDLPGYIAKNSDANVISLLSDVAEGLSYLHSCDVIHGDLKGSNILVDATDRARITDFGLVMVTQDPDQMGSARWIAPEILEGGTYSKEADIFSFAGVTIEAFTGVAPFSDRQPHEVKSAFECGERPPRPYDPRFTDEIWTLIQRCWDKEANLRPHALRISCGFKGIPAWKCLIDRPLASDERISLITDIFSNRDDTEEVRRLHGDDAHSFVDVVDEMSNALAPRLRVKCLGALRMICGQQALLPRSLQITPHYNQFGRPRYSSGCADLWEGEYQDRKVAVKVLKMSASNDLDKITQRFCKGVIMCRSLNHSNVLPLLGATMYNGRFTVISTWMDNGNINDFVRDRESVNLFELLKDVSRGLIYLHEQEVIHGGLKGTNILIDQNHHACLADLEYITMASTSGAEPCRAIRWMSPELIRPGEFHSRPTKESDRYALGMVILEVLSGQVPFAGCQDAFIVQMVLQGQRPPRPEEVRSTDLWETLQRCWSFHREERPTAEVVLDCLERISPDIGSYILSGRDFDEPIERLETEDLMLVVESLDKALDDLSPDGFTFKRTHRKLQRICLSRRVLPSSHMLLDGALNTDDHPFSSGGFSDVYKGAYKGLRVCVKKLRVAPETDSEQTTKTLFREALPWKRLTHRNIVPFLGVSIEPPQIVSEWMPRGNLTAYVKSNPQEDRVLLLVGVAKGLDYMHSHGMIHGDLKGPNILIDLSGCARITDFGLVQDSLGVVSIPEHRSVRWTAPEVLEETQKPSMEADVFSFGMVMVEAFTGTVPFGDYNSMTAMMSIIRGNHPPRPMHPTLTDKLWDLMNQCWGKDRRGRPRMLEVLLALNPIGDSQPTIRERTPSICEPSPPFYQAMPHIAPLPVIAHSSTFVLGIQRRLENLDPSHEEYRPLLFTLLSHPELKPHVNDLQGHNLERFVELLDKALDHIPVTDDLFRTTLRRLQSTCGDKEVLPWSYFIPDGGISNRERVFVAGGSTDAHMAKFNGKNVCIKTLRSDVRRKTFYGGVIVWKRLQHPNIVPFVGVPAGDPTPAIIHDWMEHGGIAEYVRQHPEGDQMGLRLLWDAAEGLHHLHLYGIVHGDLKSSSVLIDENGHARLTGYGLTPIVPGNQFVDSLQDGRPTAVPTWAAPEISEGRPVAKEGDIFTFAMVVVETFTEHFLSVKCYDAVSTGGHPERPAALSDDLWNLMQSCWNRDPGKRPTSSELVDFFRQSSIESGNTGLRSDLSPGASRMGGNAFRRGAENPGPSSSAKRPQSKAATKLRLFARGLGAG